jgi:hypothetical protein
MSTAPTCPCVGASDFFADASYRCPLPLRELVEGNSSKYPEHFDSEMMELSLEDFRGGPPGYCRCAQCLRWWYLEFASEETQWPIFGVKVSEEDRLASVVYNKPNTPVPVAKRQILVELLGESDEGTCIHAGCARPRLNLVSMCSDHYGFPW